MAKGLDVIEYGVGEYKFYQKDELLLTLRYLQTEKIIVTKDKRFLVLQHATISEDFANTIFNNGDLFDLKITREIRYILSGDVHYVTEEYENAKLKTFIVEKECGSVPTYRMFFIV